MDKRAMHHYRFYYSYQPIPEPEHGQVEVIAVDLGDAVDKARRKLGQERGMLTGIDFRQVEVITPSAGEQRG